MKLTKEQRKTVELAESGEAGEPVCPCCSRRVYFGPAHSGCPFTPRPDGTWNTRCRVEPVRGPRWPERESSEHINRVMNSGERRNRVTAQPVRVVPGARS